MRTISFWVCPSLVLCLGAPLAAQQTRAPIKEETPGLAAQAKITPDAARKTALTRVPNAAIGSEEIEREHGKLIYSFDMKRPGYEGIEEVQIDALTGAVLAVEHENPVAEAREAAGEKAEHPPVRLKEETPGLADQAKITPDAARKTALARVPDGVIASEEIEKEHGKLIYSFDIKVAGKKGIEEVQIDALTGAVVAVAHENAAAEARESAGEQPKPEPPPRP